jgi:hypothetical protein
MQSRLLTHGINDCLLPSSSPHRRVTVWGFTSVPTLITFYIARRDLILRALGRGSRYLHFLQSRVLVIFFSPFLMLFSFLSSSLALSFTAFDATCFANREHNTLDPLQVDPRSSFVPQTAKFPRQENRWKVSRSPSRSPLAVSLCRSSRGDARSRAFLDIEATFSDVLQFSLCPHPSVSSRSNGDTPAV